MKNDWLKHIDKIIQSHCVGGNVFLYSEQERPTAETPGSISATILQVCDNSYQAYESLVRCVRRFLPRKTIRNNDDCRQFGAHLSGVRLRAQIRLAPKIRWWAITR